MPFVQMENISLFLRACKAPPLNLQEHDVFLTVDLYEAKDPAQVLQCLSAFSRAASGINPAAFPNPIGPRRAGVLSPQSTGGPPATPQRGRGISNASNTSSAYGREHTPRPVLASKTGDSASGRWSPTKSPTKSPSNGSTSPGLAVSSWSRKGDEGSTAPAWNINQYGYMGGASQGNLGIAFGGRRQITSALPYVPSLQEKEKLRREKAEAEERQRQQMEEEEQRRQAEIEAEEERARQEEERRWEEDTRRLRAEEKRKAEEEKRRWEEEERMWKLTEEKRRKEEEEAKARLDEERKRSRARSRSRTRLQGQYLSQYQAEQGINSDGEGEGYSSRVKELERELQLAREREKEYERDRQTQSRGGTPAAAPDPRSRARSRSRPRPPSRQDSWSRDQREILHTPTQPDPPTYPALSAKSPRPLPDPTPAKVKSHRTGERPPIPPRLKSQRTGDRPLPQVRPQRTGDDRPLPLQKQRTGDRPAPPVKTHNTGGRPLPNPNAYSSPAPAFGSSPAPPQSSSPYKSRTDRYLASNQAPAHAAPQQTYSRELGATAERDAEDRRRAQRQATTKAGGWAGKSLLEREMEMERQRQKEWEEAQSETAKAVPRGDGVDGIGGGIDGRWDVNQWTGYTGGDSQNRVGTGIGAGRRQIVGPRPLPGPPGTR